MDDKSMSIPKPTFDSCDETSLKLKWPRFEIKDVSSVKLQYKEVHEDWVNARDVAVSNFGS